jgi:hypothetical protein
MIENVLFTLLCCLDNFHIGSTFQTVLLLHWLQFSIEDYLNSTSSPVFLEKNLFFMEAPFCLIKLNM